MRAHPATRSFAPLFIAALAGVLMPGLAADAPGQPPETNRPALMRQKLEHSKQILEGLATGDLDLVAEAAKKLKVLADAEMGVAPSPPDAKQYQALLSDFIRRVDDLSKQSRARNVDRATIAYVQITLSCVECHELVRGGRPPSGRE